jgi:hypothetical protein
VKSLIKIITSLRLTVTLLAFGIVLVFVGTVAQADEGLYQAQARYFKHWFVSGITFFGHKIPLPLPGGYLIGTLLLVNLTAAHIQRFQWTWKKAGIHLTHAGIVLLLVGQLATDLLSRETQLRFAEGETKSWSESAMDYELAFLTDLDATNEQVVAIPAQMLARGGEIKFEKLPFAVRVKDYWPNSEPNFRAPMQENDPPLTTNGIARNFDFRQIPLTHKMDDKNVPTVVVELSGAGVSAGTWVVSGWAGDETMVFGLRRYYADRMTEQMASTIVARLTEPQFIRAGGKTVTFTLRPARTYKPYTLTLLKATHAVYPGTKTPKDFRSRVRINNPARGEDREVEIYMNNPLRYAGVTFFQHQMAAGDLAQELGQIPSSTLQVVRNPGWITPYAGCIIVAAGLITQFMIHLVGFLSKRAKT